MSRAASMLSWEEYSRVAHALKKDGKWERLLQWLLGGFTAYRVSDYAELTWGQLLATNTLTISEKKTSYFNKAARTVYLADELVEMIDECRAHMNPHSVGSRPLFRGKRVGRKGQRRENEEGHAFLEISNLRKRIKRIRVVYDIESDISPHSLRKCFAKHVFDQHGGTFEALMVVQKMLGHSSHETTKRYLGIGEERIKQTYKGLRLYGSQ